ncbi:MAG: Gfo/Idh/MocA family oxidoreductase [Spirochaetes bacterium]|nr:Gfo/Idh/MocA family oxidoreductase [Spirochaetota bacterium]
METKKINCAIVGLGRIGSTLEFDRKREKPASHAGVISAHKECVLSSGCDIDEAKCSNFKNDWNCPDCYTSLSQMLENHRIDILHIATPPETHKNILEKAIESKIPVIIVEKPVSDNLKDAVKIEKMSLKSDSRIIVNHERRYTQQTERIKKNINECRYGKLLSINSKMYMGRKRSLESMIYDDGTHIIDLINYLSGGCLRIDDITGSEKEGHVSVYAHCSEIYIQMEFARGREYLLFETDLSFEKGRIISGNGYYDEFESRESPYYENFYSLMNKDVNFSTSGYFIRMFEDAVRCFKDPGLVPVSDITDGVNAVRIINEIIRKI